MMDLESIRNLCFFCVPLSIAGLIGSIILFAEGEIGGIMPLTGAIIFALPLLSHFLLKKKYKKQNHEMALQHAKYKLIIALQQINRSYMLGLPELAGQDGLPSGMPQDRIIYQRITSADDPIAAFAKEIKPGKPTISDFCLSMETMLDRLMKEMQLSDGDIGNIYIEFLSMITDVTDDLIGDVAASFASDLPPQMYFLKDKINYELAALGVIMQYGIDNERQDICQKVNAIRKKRGYTN